VYDLKNEYVVVIVTTASEREAESIVQHILKEKLIACANVFGPVHSHFYWSGKLEEAEEYLIFMKSRKDLFERIAEIVKALHSYEVPEIVALPIVDGSEEYLDWLDSCLPAKKG
jgi:periplasmic divalent cation tolerance protein